LTEQQAMALTNAISSDSITMLF